MVTVDAPHRCCVADDDDDVMMLTAAVGKVLTFGVAFVSFLSGLLAFVLSSSQI